MLIDAHIVELVRLCVDLVLGLWLHWELQEIRKRLR
jgi:hypothetical protein